MKQHTPRQGNEKPSSALDMPKALHRTEDRRRGSWNEGGLASTDGSVTNGQAPITECQLAPRSDPKDVEVARRRVEKQRLGGGQEDPTRAVAKARSEGGTVVAPGRG